MDSGTGTEGRQGPLVASTMLTLHRPHPGVLRTLGSTLPRLHPLVHTHDIAVVTRLTGISSTSLRS
jgi:hypothetical protein